MLRGSKCTVQISIGGFGVRTASLSWDILAQQYGLAEPEDGWINLDDCDDVTSGVFNTFEEISDGQITPRAMFIDTDPEVLDYVQSCNCKRYFSDHHFAVNPLQSSDFKNCTSLRARMDIILELAHEKLQCQIENCDNFEGNMFINSVEGGTGSRISQLLVEEITDAHSKQNCNMHALWPSPHPDSTTGPYNTILCYTASGSLGCHYLYNNQALYNRTKFVTSKPTLRDLNDNVALLVAASANDCKEMQTNCVPFPVCNGILTGTTPDIQIGLGVVMTDAKQLMVGLSRDKNRLHSCKPQDGSLMGGLIMYHHTEQMFNSKGCSLALRQSFTRASWIRDVASVARPPLFYARGSKFGDTIESMSAFLNSTVVKTVYQDVIEQYDILSQFGSFKHFYTKDGITSDDFEEAREIMRIAVLNYEDLDLECAVME